MCRNLVLALPSTNSRRQLTARSISSATTISLEKISVEVAVFLIKSLEIGHKQLVPSIGLHDFLHTFESWIQGIIGS